MKYFDKEAKAEYVMRSTLVKSADAIVTKAYRAAGFGGDIKIEPESYQYLMRVSIKDMFDGRLPGGQESDEHRIGDTILLKYNDENSLFEINLLLRLNGMTGITMRVMHYEDGQVYVFDHEKNEWSLFTGDNESGGEWSVSLEDEAEEGNE